MTLKFVATVVGGLMVLLALAGCSTDDNDGGKGGDASIRAGGSGQ